MKTEKEIREEAQASKGNQIFAKTCEEQDWCRVEMFTKNKWAKYDVAYKIKGTKTLGEIKIRTKDYPTYLLELDKYYALVEMQTEIKEVRDIDVDITYINILPGNRTYIWNLTNLDLSKYGIKREWHNKNDFDDTKVLKDVIYLWNSDTQIKCETEEEFTIFKRENNNYEEDGLPF